MSSKLARSKLTLTTTEATAFSDSSDDVDARAPANAILNSYYTVVPVPIHNIAVRRCPKSDVIIVAHLPLVPIQNTKRMKACAYPHCECGYWRPTNLSKKGNGNYFGPCSANLHETIQIIRD